MSKLLVKAKKYRLTLTDEELRALEERLAVVNPNEYDLHTLDTLRNLYGRIFHIRLRSER